MQEAVVDGPWTVPGTEDGGPRRVSRRGWVVVGVLGGLFCLAGLSLVAVMVPFDAHRVMSVSMEPAYPQGTRVLSLPVGSGDVTRGDVVLVDSPGAQVLPGDVVVIGRVVAIGGDRVEDRDGRLVVNGELVDEDYLAEGTRIEGLGPTTVPDGHVYLLGDNRSNSRDSRAYGPVHEGSIRARVVLSWSLDHWLLAATAVSGAIFVVAVVRVARRRTRPSGHQPSMEPAHQGG